MTAEEPASGRDASDLPATDDLAELFDLEELDTDLYRAMNETSARYRPSLFGGQVAAQALRAAAYTVPEGRFPHSLHGYFLRPGRPDRQVILRVDRDRDGRSFSARRVVAVQNGEVIFGMSASFQQAASPERPGPESREWSTPREPAAGPDQLQDRSFPDLFVRPLQVRAMPPVVPYEQGTWPVPARMWARSRVPLPDDPLVHACVLTYASDLGSGFGDGTVADVPRGGPSLDHSIWFHEPLRMDEWFLIEQWPLKAGGGRGLYAGTIQDGAGRVGAMLTQEMLLRAPRLEPPPADPGAG